MVRLITFPILATTACALHAQDADRAIRQGNAELEKGHAQAAVRAFDAAKQDQRAVFNSGNAWYAQDSLERSAQAFERASAMAKNETDQARAWHNLGNARLRQKQYQEAIGAYKEALKRTPDDPDTRYNLAYAQKMLAAQEQKQRQKQQDKQQDQQQQDKQQQNQDRPQDQQRQDQQPRAPEQGQDQDRIDPQDAKRMLDAAQQQEKNVQDAVRRKLQPEPEKPAEKDW